MSLINLLPDDYIKRRQQQRANVLCLALFGVVMLGLAAAVLVSERSIYHNRQVAQRVDDAYADATKMLSQLQQLQAQRGHVMHKARRTAELLERVPRSTLLAMVTNALPRQASLTRFQLLPKQIVSAASCGEAATKFEQVQAARNGNKVSEVVVVEVDGLAGTDVDVALFIANLLRNPLLTGVDLAYSQEKEVDDHRVREFQVRMEVKPDVDVADALKAVKSRFGGEPTGEDALAQAGQGEQP